MTRTKARKIQHKSKVKTKVKKKILVPPPASRAGAVDVLARTLYGEARGEKLPGKEAVASVVLNRVRRARHAGGYWWGSSIEEVCRKPWQFSCWNEDDANRDKIKSVTPANRIFAACQRIAHRAVAGTLKDTTGGATHYHTRSVSPPWARGRAPSAEIGNHLFYSDIA